MDTKRKSRVLKLFKNRTFNNICEKRWNKQTKPNQLMKRMKSNILKISNKNAETYRNGVTKSIINKSIQVKTNHNNNRESNNENGIKSILYIMNIYILSVCKKKKFKYSTKLHRTFFHTTTCFISWIESWRHASKHHVLNWLRGVSFSIIKSGELKSNIIVTLNDNRWNHISGASSPLNESFFSFLSFFLSFFFPSTCVHIICIFDWYSYGFPHAHTDCLHIIKVVYHRLRSQFSLNDCSHIPWQHVVSTASIKSAYLMCMLNNVCNIND